MIEPAHDPRHRANDADRLLEDPLLKRGLALMEKRLLEELLIGPPSSVPYPVHDQWRREKIDRINVLRTIPNSLRGALMEAMEELRVKPGVA